VGHDLSPDVVVAADGGPASGLGHLSRSGAVAAALRAKGRSVACFALGASASIRHDVEWQPAAGLADCPTPRAGGVFILDSYDHRAGDARDLLGAARLVAMHDRSEQLDLVDLVVSLTAREAPDVLAGPAYACLRPEFWGLAAPPPAPELRSLLVTVGAGASPSDLAGAIAARLPAVAVSLVVGRLAESADAVSGVRLVERPASLLAELAAADLVVCAGGQTALESLASGRATVAVVTAENQLAQVQLLESLGAVRSVYSGRPETVAETVAGLAADRAERERLASRGPELIDGYGALRVAYRVERLLAAEAR
jgi:spore coat polysaccharide biosynthesis predicted glycosyltransferase SpsG